MTQPTAREATQAQADFAASFSLATVPERVQAYAKGLILDALACALAGHQGEETPQVAVLAGALGQSRESSVIGGDRLSLAGATVLNGFLITAVTMCDTHRATLTHIMPEILPPAFAIAERDGLSGRDLLSGIIAGGEVATRIGLGLDYPVFRAKGWHGPGVLGPFGAAAPVGRLRGFNAETMARAFGLAGSQAAGTFAAWGTPTVKFHQCRGALSGLMAALLAEQCFVATREFLTASDDGLYKTYTEGGRTDLALEELGARWEIERLSLRPWPAATHIQSAVTALFELIEQHDIAPEKVQQVRLAMSKTPFEMHGGFATYEGKFEALLSAHYAAAVILHDRSLTLAQFEPERYGDPALRRFTAERVAVRMDPTLAEPETRLEIAMTDGRVLATHCRAPRGTPDNPLTQEQIEEKFRTYAPSRLSDTRVAKIIDAVYGLETLPSARTLIAALRA